MQVGQHLLAVGVADAGRRGPPRRSSPGPPGAGRPSARPRARRRPGPRAARRRPGGASPRPARIAPAGTAPARRHTRPRSPPAPSKLLAHLPACPADRRGHDGDVRQAVQLQQVGRVAGVGRPATRGDEHALQRPEGGPQPRPVQRSRLSGSWTSPPRDGRLQPPRMRVAADREGRVGDLEQTEVHVDPTAAGRPRSAVRSQNRK